MPDFSFFEPIGLLPTGLCTPNRRQTIGNKAQDQLKLLGVTIAKIWRFQNQACQAVVSWPCCSPLKGPVRLARLLILAVLNGSVKWVDFRKVAFLCDLCFPAPIRDGHWLPGIWAKLKKVAGFPYLQI